MARGTVKQKRLERGLYEKTTTYTDGTPPRVVFQIRYGDGAGDMVSDTFTTRAKARAALARARTSVMDGDHINPGSGDTKFLQVAEDWLSSHPHWKIKTRVANEGAVRRSLAPLHGMRMKQLDASEVHDFRTQFTKTPTSRGTLPAPGTIKRTMAVLSSIFEHARLRRHIAANPCSDLRRLKLDEVEVVPPTLKQVFALIDALRQPVPERTDSRGRTYASKPADRRWTILVEVAAWTGLRSGELAGLKKADLDFEAGTLTVRRAIVDTTGGLREETPKTRNSKRTIQIGAQLARRLASFTIGLRQNDYVFGSTSNDGGWKPLRHNQFQGRVFAPACRDLGIDITFHDLRHFHASILIEDGWDPIEVSRRLGHADASITFRKYSHLFDLRRSSAGVRIDALRDRVSGTRPRPKARAAAGAGKGKKPF